MQTHTINYELYTMKFISCHVNKTHSFDVIVVADENVVIVMGINISIIIFVGLNHFNYVNLFLQLWPVPGLSSVCS
jgi:hypothetical protein